MKILAVASHYPDKLEPLTGVFFKEQFEALAQSGMDLIVVAFDFRSLRKKRKWGIYKHNTDHFQIYTISLPLSPLPLIVEQLIIKSIYKPIYKLILKENERIDVLYACVSDFAGYFAYKVKHRWGTPYVIAEHYGEHYRLSIGNKHNVRRFIKTNFIKIHNDADWRTAVNPDYAIALVNAIAKNNVSVIPNFIDFSMWGICNKNRKKGFTFLCINRLDPIKRTDMVVKAFHNVTRRFPGINLNIVGDGEERRNIEKLIVELDMCDKISMLGTLKRGDVKKQLHSADCLILASDSETFGVVLLEALACGLPIISTKCDGPKNIVDNTCGLLVDIGNQEKLEEALITVYKEYDKYDKQLIRQNAMRKFDVNVIIDELKDIFREVGA